MSQKSRGHEIQQKLVKMVLLLTCEVGLKRRVIKGFLPKSGLREVKSLSDLNLLMIFRRAEEEE